MEQKWGMTFSWGLLATLIFCTSFALADDVKNPYSFGGNCQSQGYWTSTATMELEKIKSIADTLRADPNCNQLSARLTEYYNALSAQTNLPAGAEVAANRSSTLRAQLDSVVSYSRNGRYEQDKIKEAMVASAVDSAIVAADSAKTSNNPMGGTPQQTATNLQALGSRINRSVHTGLDLVNNLAESTIEESKCLQNPNVSGPLMSSIIAMASAFGSSGQDAFGTKIARLTNTISKLMITRRYYDTTNKLGRAQFRNSMSCLLETVSESYCATLDADILYQEHVHQSGFQRDPKSGVISTQGVLGAKLNSPLRGFFVLTQLVPIVTGWVEKVQRGVEPRNSADSQFKNDILRNTITYYIQENNLMSTANFDQQTIKKLPDLVSKKRQVLKTVMQLSAQITGGREELQGLNFYTMAVLPMEIPFRLIGIPLPDKVRGSQESGVQQEPGQYLAANIDSIAAFNDPDRLMATVVVKLRGLIEEAQHNVIAYYNEWFIYDQASQYVDSVTGFTYNARDVLQHIDRYFDYVGDKIRENSQMDPSVLPMIEDTRRRIQNVLARYEELRLLGETFRKTSAAAKDEREALINQGVELHRKLLETAYEEFWILRARSGFLLGRVAGIVKYDMQNLLRANPEETNKVAKDIFFATGEAAFERMKTMSGSNPYMIYADIKLAQVTHLENLEAIESLLADNFAMSMSWIRMVSRNERPNDGDVRADSLRRLIEDFAEYYPPRKLRPVTKPWDIWWMFEEASISGPFQLGWHYWKHANRYSIWGQNTIVDTTGRAPYDSYPASTPHNGNVLFPDEGAAERMLAHYCIQSLAFKDSSPFKRMCDKINLNSPFLYYTMTDEEKTTYEKASPLMKFKVRHDLLGLATKEFIGKELSVNYNQKREQLITPEILEALKSPDDVLKKGARQLMARNQSSRVCALREFARNNFVEYLTQGLERK